MKKKQFITLLILFSICTLVYYFGELVDYTGWSSLRWSFFYEVHDTHRLFFLVPIIYAACFFGTKWSLFTTVAALLVFLPRAIWQSPFPNPLMRAIIFDIIAGAIGFLVAMLYHKRFSIPSVPLRVSKTSVDASDSVNSALVLNIDDLQIDFSKRLVKLGGQIVKLTPKEYELLSCMAKNSGKVLSHNELLLAVWGTNYGGQTEYLHTFVWQLRRKIEHDPSKPEFIVTVQGFGYRFADTK